MIRNLGYPCTALGLEAQTNRTCRLVNATPERLRELIAANLDGLRQTLRYIAGPELRVLHYRLHSS